MAPQQREAEASSQSRQALPEDRFDNLPKSRRVGAHRITAKPRRFWLYLVAAIAGIAVLTGAGIIAVHSIGAGVSSSIGDAAEAPAAEEQVRAEADPEATIAVLNGTDTPNLQAGVEQVILANEWGQIAFSDYAASREVQISAVFYSDPEDETAAAGLAAMLGGVSTYVSADYGEYGVRLVVLLGADYAGPGFDEAAAITQGMDGE